MDWANYPSLPGDERDRPKGVASVQTFERDGFHRWYNFILGYSDRLVSEMLDEFDVKKGALVLDPFCGTGTTLVECAKRDVKAIGIDANPFAIFATNTKCKFDLDPECVAAAARGVIRRYREALPSNRRFSTDKTYEYIKKSGMLERGWISPRPLRKALLLRDAIVRCKGEEIRDVLMLALLAELPSNIGNMRFGPQIHIGVVKNDVDPIPNFRKRVAAICEDLAGKNRRFAQPHAFLGDARTLRPALRRGLGINVPQIDFVICSPPYPTEHDYTRHTRLELAFTNLIETRQCVRAIKRTMVRSHTKGIYWDDSDLTKADGLKSVERIANLVAEAVKNKSSGFEKLYPTVVRAYFGGMKRHFTNLYPLMKSGGRACYVVGDQAAYMRVPIRTAKLLGETAEAVGFQVESIRLWRKRFASGISDYLEENILILRKPIRTVKS